MKLWPPSYLYKRLQWMRYRTNVLRAIMPFRDAVTIARSEGRNRLVRVFLTPANRQIAIRLDTSDTRCVEQVFLAREYEIPFPGAPRVIVDAGANIGMATLYFARTFPDAKVIAIEPEPSNFALLQSNCGSLKNVTLIQGALWPTTATLTLEDESAEKWGMSVTDVRRLPGPTQSVIAVTIPEILERFAIAEIDLLKLDIEGSERDLFSCCPQNWLGRVGMIAIELHDRFRPGCAQALYAALSGREFAQEIRGENIFINLRRDKAGRNVDEYRSINEGQGVS
jgi:FkbM family methyltransferase